MIWGCHQQLQNDRRVERLEEEATVTIYMRARDCGERLLSNTKEEEEEENNNHATENDYLP